MRRVQCRARGRLSCNAFAHAPDAATGGVRRFGFDGTREAKLSFRTAVACTTLKLGGWYVRTCGKERRHVSEGSERKYIEQQAAFAPSGPVSRLEAISGRNTYTISISAGSCDMLSVARRARSKSAGGILLLRARVSSVTRVSSSCLRLVVRTAALSEVDFTPSMAAETSRDTITCTN